MRLDDSDDLNVEDQRGGNYSRAGFGGGGGLGGMALSILPFIYSRFGCMGVIVVGALFLIFGGGLSGIGSMLGGGTTATTPQVASRSDGTTSESCNINASSRLTCNGLASVNATWAQLMKGYQQPKLVFYSGNGQSGCGAAQAAMGPFYCPADQGIYIDTRFYDELQQRFGAPGDFAQLYVVAHEVGHHVQHLSGTADRVAREQQRVGRSQGNALQVAMELQADCYAGVWAARNRDRLDPGDIEEGLGAAQAIGDDTLQKAAGQRPVSDSFTHGSSAQRQQWLQRGLQSGDPNQCDTFGGR